VGFLNNSSKFKNNFGINKEGLFPGGRDDKREEKNWLATFTKSGCIACRNEQGRVNHTGRDGTPVVLVVGDESVPSVVGHTDEGERETRCAWVLKKEHLALEEVAGILDRVNKQKREADKKRGKRMHEFFVPNGSKILVGSYVHLRREGLEGYVADFNSMVRAIREVTGDCGIEVLPVAPVVFEGLDETGKFLIQGAREWIKWVGEKSGREEICALSETGGRETEDECEQTVIWRPTFMISHGKQAGVNVLRERGNTMTLLREGRVEWKLRKAGLAREISRLTGGSGSRRAEGAMETDGTGDNTDRMKQHTDDDDKQKKRDSFECGVSIEGEFAFVRAVGDLCKKGVRAGRFRGNYNFNLKRQMEMRELIELRSEKRENVSVIFVGGSQMGRLAKEIAKNEGRGVLVQGMVRVKGKLDEKAVDDALEELAGLKDQPEKILIGGPTNSLVEHGSGENRGFGPERQVKVRINQDSGETE
jgi:hypothetical protein